MHQPPGPRVVDPAPIVVRLQPAQQTDHFGIRGGGVEFG